MYILIADDTAAVVQNFSKAIRKLGHTPILCNSLREACKIIEDPSQYVDIAFLDNHFHGEDYGIDKVREFRSKKPDMDIVVTTKRDVRPDLVADVVNLQVGFFKKQSDDPTLLDAEISQRVNIRRAKDEALGRRIAEFQKAATEGGEGIRRLLHFVTGSRTKHKPEVVSLEPTNQHLIVPRFERFQTIHVGQQVEIAQEFVLDRSQNWKASTTLELGLGIDESVRFFSSTLGLQIKSMLNAKCSIEEASQLKSSYRVGHKLSLTTDEINRQIRRREYYRGIDHAIYKVVVRSSCGHCGTSDLIELRVFVPVNVVEVSVAFDKQGFKVPGEDGREAYHQLRP